MRTSVSSMASYDTGYEDELFQYPVGPSLHCCICTNVIKDPAMCHNEHIFCRACITRHLMYSQTCPTCMQPLTVQTLRQAPRTLTNLLAELKIRCEFVDRGCEIFTDLGDLERHVAECGFAPAVCSNEGCQLEVNKQDLLHHETAVCELRRVQCHSCNDIRREMDTVKVNLAAISDSLGRNQKTVEGIEGSQKIIEENVKAVEANVVAKFNLVQEQLNKQEESNRQLKADNVEIKKSLNEITKQLERITQQTSHEVQAEQLKKGIAEADEIDKGPKVVVAGGMNSKMLSSVEMFCLATRTWTQLRPMRERREGASSVVSENSIVVSGGFDNDWIKSIEKLSLNAVHVDHSIPWENVPAELRKGSCGHCTIVYIGRLIVIGGYDSDKLRFSDSIIEISIAPCFTSKLLTTMPEGIWFHAVAMFGDKIVIVGGEGSRRASGWASVRADLVLSSVLMYDITENKCRQLVPLPYPVYKMAIVKWDDDNVMIMGGADSERKPLNKVLMYNIKTQKSHMLPDMKYKRKGCVAAVVRDTVIVMGGQDDKGNYLKSVESFRFDRYSWEELAEMHEARCQATAIVC